MHLRSSASLRSGGRLASGVRRALGRRRRPSASAYSATRSGTPGSRTPGSGAPGSRRHGAAAGFSLVEALVGLALLALVLGSSLAVTYRLPRHLERLEARRDALRSAEMALESLRAGLVPMSAGRQAWPLTVPSPPRRRLRAWVEVAPTATPDLYAVEIEVSYRSLGAPRVLRLETMAWRP